MSAQGSGERPTDEFDDPYEYEGEPTEFKCSKCHGHGHTMEGFDCEYCDGTGTVEF